MDRRDIADLLVMGLPVLVAVVVAVVRTFGGLP